MLGAVALRTPKGQVTVGANLAPSKGEALNLQPSKALEWQGMNLEPSADQEPSQSAQAWDSDEEAKLLEIWQVLTKAFHLQLWDCWL